MSESGVGKGYPHGCDSGIGNFSCASGIGNQNCASGIGNHGCDSGIGNHGCADILYQPYETRCHIAFRQKFFYQLIEFSVFFCLFQLFLFIQSVAKQQALSPCSHVESERLCTLINNTLHHITC